MFGLRAWAWAHGMVIVHTDNTTAQFGMYDSTIRASATMNALREKKEVFVRAAGHDRNLFAIRISSIENALADALSRQD